MVIGRFVRMNLVLFIPGVAVAGLWIYLTGPKPLADLAQVHLGYGLLLLAITVLCILLRFIRWQFLLRRAGVRLPTRPSLSIYMASLVGIATPAYAGEVIRSLFIRRRFGIPIRTTASVLVLERLLDVVALGTIGVLATDTWWMRDMLALLVLAAGLIAFVGARLAPRLGVLPAAVVSLSKRIVLMQALALSFAAWLSAALLVTIAARSLGTWVSLIRGMGVFSSATLLGGLTLTPAGIGTTGSLAILQLRGLGLTLADAVVVVSLLRLASVGVALAVGVMFLVHEWKGLQRAVENDSVSHFNRIAAHYDRQFSAHIWNHLLDRKVRLLAAALPDPPRAGIGLDLGCGLGCQSLQLGGLGYHVVGVDPAQSLAQQANGAGVPVAVGQAGALPFLDASFDFVFSVGVIHHLPGLEVQEAALREVRRVLKPGGHLIIHETNPRNPFFRFYMGYLFPLVKSIDQGTEWWVEPHRWRVVKGMRLVNLQYFTFLPDFIPRSLMRTFLAFERRLEASPLRPYSVHYMVTLQKDS